MNFVGNLHLLLKNSKNSLVLFFSWSIQTRPSSTMALIVSSAQALQTFFLNDRWGHLIVAKQKCNIFILHSVRCIQPTIFFSRTKPAPASSHQPASSTFLSQQISTSYQPQHSEQSLFFYHCIISEKFPLLLELARRFIMPSKNMSLQLKESNNSQCNNQTTFLLVEHSNWPTLFAYHLVCCYKNMEYMPAEPRD